MSHSEKVLLRAFLQSMSVTIRLNIKLDRSIVKSNDSAKIIDQCLDDLLRVSYELDLKEGV